MNTTKKTAKSKASVKSVTDRIPKGYIGAGQFASKERIAAIKAEAKLQKERERKDRKNIKLREKRAADRQAKKTFMARPDAVTTRSELQHKIGGWGSTSTSRLRATRTYAWHGAFRVSGATPQQLNNIARSVGSSSVKPVKNSDGSYDILLTPFLGFHTPAEAAALVDDGQGGQTSLIDLEAKTYFEQEFKGASNVAYLGAFYNAERDSE